jgi:hypothetical protein
VPQEGHHVLLPQLRRMPQPMMTHEPPHRCRMPASPAPPLQRAAAPFNALDAIRFLRSPASTPPAPCAPVPPPRAAP